MKTSFDLVQEASRLAKQIQRSRSLAPGHPERSAIDLASMEARLAGIWNEIRLVRASDTAASPASVYGQRTNPKWG